MACIKNYKNRGRTMRFIVYMSGAILAFVVFGLYLSQYNLSVHQSIPFQENSLDYYDYKGALNIHTDMSLGSESIDQIASAAKQAGLDFILITDLNPFYETQNFESYFDKTLILNGGKYSYLDSRLNYYNKKNQIVGTEMGDIQIFFSDRLSKNIREKSSDLVWLAHPFGTEYNWNGPAPDGLNGVEVLNLKSLTQAAYKKSVLNVFWSFLIYPFNPKLAFMRLFQEPSKEINFFDTTSQQRPFVAYAGSEASARSIPFPGALIKFPSYYNLFSLVSNHILLKSELTGQLESDREKIFSALEKGQFYLCLDALGDPKGFYAHLLQSKQVHPIGTSVSLSKDLKIAYSLPSEPNTFFEVVLYRNGLSIETSNKFKGEFSIKESGVYRIQVRVIPNLPLPDARKWFTWIYTNNFYVK